MRDRAVPPRPSSLLRRRLHRTGLVLFGLLLVCCCVLASPNSALAQVTLRILVVDFETKAPITLANVRLESDTERTRNKGVDPTGTAIFEDAAVGTTYRAFPTALNYVYVDPTNPTKAFDDQRKGAPTYPGFTITVPPDAMGEVSVTVPMKKRPPITEVVDVAIEFINLREVGNLTVRDQRFIRDFPLTAGNRQNLSRVLPSAPGMVRDSMNRVHARGEYSAVKPVYLDGILLPQYAEGSAAAFILPDYIGVAPLPNRPGGLTIRTGGLEARFGGGSGAILDIALHNTPRYPFIDYALRIGGYDTTELFFTFGNAIRGPGFLQRRQKDPNARPITYFLTLSQRYTQNALEPPQPNRQTTRNGGASELFFGKFDYQLSPNTVATALLNYSSGRSGIAARTGLDSSYAEFGQGLGFGGLQNPTSGLLSQAALGQNFQQKDNNNFTILQLKSRQPRSGMRSNYAIGATESSLAIRNRGGNTSAPNRPNFPGNSSFEYSPFVRQEYDQAFIQADFSMKPRPVGALSEETNPYRVRFGFVYQDQQGGEVYQLIPGSSAALEALRNNVPRLAPGADNLAPIGRVARTGYFAAAYLQDTINVRDRLTINYGARFDAYKQSAGVTTLDPVTGRPNGGADLPSVNKTGFSPRLNVAMPLTERGPRFLRAIARQPTVIRASYDRLFTAPVLGQGTFAFDQSVQPQVVDQYDTSIERQFGSNKVAKIAIFSKDIKNALASGQAVPGPQAGIVSTFNIGDHTADGFEISFELFPSRGAKPLKDANKRRYLEMYGDPGFHAYLVYTNSEVRPSRSRQRNNLGQVLSVPFPEIDQANTMNLGVAYNTPEGASVGMTFYYGSGLYSSRVAGIAGPSVQSPVRFGGRETMSEVNLKLSSGPRFLRNTTAIQLDVENLTDSRSRMNFASALAGTRFQQGRRVFLSVNGRF